MSTVTSRGTTIQGTSGTTWASTANMLDGVPGDLDPETYATWTNATSNATGYIEVTGFHTAFAAIPAGSTIDTVTIWIHHLVSVTAPISTLKFQPYLGATPLGTAGNATKSTTVRDDWATFTPILLSDLQSSTFRVRLTAQRAASTTSAVWRIDHTDVVVDYTPPAMSGRPKVWNGSGWVQKPMKVWNGTAWVEKPVKVWTGSAWKTLA